MTFDANDILRFISRAEATRLFKLGATVTKDGVTATEEQLWHAGPSVRHELLKAGLLTISAGGGGGGGGAYVAKAVHFDGAAGLAIASMVATDSHLCSVVYWIKAAAPSSVVPWVVDPDGDYATYGSMTTTNLHPASFTTSVIFGDGTHSVAVTTNDDNEPIQHDDVWYCVIATVDTQAQAGTVYLNDVKSDLDFPIVQGTPFDMLFSGKGFKLCDDGFDEAVTCDLADFRFMPGVSLLTDGDISDATRRLFIDANGKPVDPALAVAALGAPVILFSGDANTFGINQGTGGPFTPTGSLTNATTSPSN